MCSATCRSFKDCPGSSCRIGMAETWRHRHFSKASALPPAKTSADLSARHHTLHQSILTRLCESQAYPVKIFEFKRETFAQKNGISLHLELPKILLQSTLTLLALADQIGVSCSQKLCGASGLLLVFTALPFCLSTTRKDTIGTPPRCHSCQGDLNMHNSQSSVRQKKLLGLEVYEV